MADKKYQLTFTLTDGTKKSVQFTAPQGPAGTGGDGGTGLPEPEGPNLQLVTDKDGNASWKEQLAYPTTGTVEILPEMTVTLDDVGESIITTPFTLEAGKTYTVAWNGVDYKCPAQSITLDGVTAVVLGDATEVGGIENGEPFVITMVPADLVAEMGGVTALIEAIDESLNGSSVAVKITGEGTIYKKVPFEYLPEGVGGVEDSVVLPEKTYESDGEEFAITTPFTLTAGNNYTVNWNGAEYKCVAQSMNTGEGYIMTTLGNIGLMTGGADTGEPFIIAPTPEGAGDGEVMGGVYILDGSTSVTLSISDETVKKIDPKYIDAEWMAEMQDVGEEILPPTLSDGVGNTLTINDEIKGKLTAGTDIIVYIDDMRYEAAMRIMDGILYAGNLSIFNEQFPNTGEPFLILDFSGMKIYFPIIKEIYKAAIYLKGNVQKLPRILPSKYLNDMSVFYLDVSQSDDGTYTGNRTFNECLMAYESNRPVYCRIIVHENYRNILPLNSVSHDTYRFSAFIEDVDSPNGHALCIVEIGKTQTIRYRILKYASS